MGINMISFTLGITIGLIIYHLIWKHAAARDEVSEKEKIELLRKLLKQNAPDFNVYKVVKIDHDTPTDMTINVKYGEKKPKWAE